MHSKMNNKRSTQLQKEYAKKHKIERKKTPFQMSASKRYYFHAVLKKKGMKVDSKNRLIDLCGQEHNKYTRYLIDNFGYLVQSRIK